jgi:hypothetical protein
MEKAARQYLLDRLIGSHWSVGAAAICAGLNRTHFYELMKRHNIRLPGAPAHQDAEEGNREWRELACSG